MRARALALTVAALLAGCGGNDDAAPGDGGGALTPAFGSAPSTTTTTAAAAASETTTSAAAGAPATAPASSVLPAADDPPLVASLEDPAGDATASSLQEPAWSDLLGARLSRSRTGFELRIRLAGGAAPDRTPDDDHTMNLASFYDVDGDGTIDYEIWANVASGGWGASYFDNDAETGAFGEESFVTVTPEGDEVVLRFALRHLDGAAAFRWSVASEWGRYEDISTDAMVRDDVPDDDGAAAFPGS